MLQMSYFPSFYDWIAFHWIYMYIDIHIFTHLSTMYTYDCFCTLATVNNTVMNTEVHVSFWISVFALFGYIPRSRIAGSYGNTCLVFKEMLYHFPQWTNQLTFLLVLHKGSLFSTSSPTFLTCSLIDNSHSERYEVISHQGCDLQFSDD